MKKSPSSLLFVTYLLCSFTSFGQFSTLPCVCEIDQSLLSVAMPKPISYQEYQSKKRVVKTSIVNSSKKTINPTESQQETLNLNNQRIPEIAEIKEDIKVRRKRKTKRIRLKKRKIKRYKGQCPFW